LSVKNSSRPLTQHPAYQEDQAILLRHNCAQHLVTIDFNIQYWQTKVVLLAYENAKKMFLVCDLQH
tara:strand:- start:844 stop:1041 length:198 start_codon:yes stop_codon:yes gene_type:complete